jgi:type IV pilus biogenesis protein CpaD/CtpE
LKDKQMINKVMQTTILMGATALLTVACTTSSAVDESFGDATRSNVRAQVYDPETLTNPSSDPVEGTDGQRMEAVMESFRSQQGSADSVANPIVINVGNGN